MSNLTFYGSHFSTESRKLESFFQVQNQSRYQTKRKEKKEKARRWKEGKVCLTIFENKITGLVCQQATKNNRSLATLQGINRRKTNNFVRKI